MCVCVCVCLSICTEEEQRGVLRFCGQKVLKVLKIACFFELGMETTHCQVEKYMSG